MKRPFHTLWMVFLALHLAAQDKPVFPLFIAPDLDSNYIELQRDLWSIRGFTSLKYHRLGVEDKVEGLKFSYLPNNLLTVGVGIAYRFWLIDLGFGVNPIKENATESFDLQTQVMLASRHLFQFGLQTYKGFNRRGDMPDIFRDDIRIFYTGLDYLYFLNYRQLSLRSVFRGDFRQKRSAWSPVGGAFIAGDYVQADSSLIPLHDANQAANSVNSYVWVAGIQAGLAGSLVFMKNFLLFGNVLPGIGGEWGKVEARGENFRPKWGPVGKINAQAALLYMHPRFYLGVTGMGHFYFPVVTPDLRYRYQVGKLKLLFGWRFRSRVELLEKANRILEAR